MDEGRRGGWVYIMADRYRGAMYVGVTSCLPARVAQHRSGDGSDFCARYGITRLVWAERGDDVTLLIAHEKRLKKWRRAWKHELIERRQSGVAGPVRPAGVVKRKKRDPGSSPG